MVLSWRNSARIRNLSYNDREITSEEHTAWFESLEKAHDRICMIFEANGTPVGVVQFFDISTTDRKCKWGFYLGVDDLPKGLGTIMGELAISYAFQNLRVDQILGESISHNYASQKFHEKLGFVQEGRIERQVYRDAKWLDIILFSISKDHWIKLHGNVRAIA